MKELNNKQITTSQTTPKASPQENKLNRDDSLMTTDYPKEIGGRKEGLEPTRYGDWEKKGRCIDF